MPSLSDSICGLRRKRCPLRSFAAAGLSSRERERDREILAHAARSQRCVPESPCTQLESPASVGILPTEPRTRQEWLLPLGCKGCGASNSSPSSREPHTNRWRLRAYWPPCAVPCWRKVDCARAGGSGAAKAMTGILHHPGRFDPAIGAHNHTDDRGLLVDLIVVGFRGPRASPLSTRQLHRP